MSEIRIELESGKYTYLYNSDTGKQGVLRYGEEWRDLTGDKFVYALAQLVLKQQNGNAELKKKLERKSVLAMSDQEEYLLDLASYPDYDYGE